MPPRLGALLAVVFWGISFVATKAAVSEISPPALIFGRTAIGTMLLCAMLALRGRPALPPRGALGPLALMGFVGRLVEQKGVDLLMEVMQQWLPTTEVQWAILAAGDPKYHRMIERMVERFPQKIAARLDFDAYGAGEGLQHACRKRQAARRTGVHAAL